MPRVRTLDVTNWLRECPECGYQNGFHLSFRWVSADSRGNNVDVRLICPTCSAVYDIGLRMRLEPASRERPALREEGANGQAREQPAHGRSY